MKGAYGNLSTTMMDFKFTEKNEQLSGKLLDSFDSIQKKTP